MKTAYGLAIVALCILTGCGELMFESEGYYQLGATSCNAVEASCGEQSTANCCITSAISGGTNENSNSPFSQMTVSAFRLDQFEVTVGRFRSFVAAYPNSKPADGHGRHERIPASGWNSMWDGALPVSQADLKKALHCDDVLGTWTDEKADNENLPINCVDWYLAFAFCAWDGGRLPTEAEWNHAAVGGDEQRIYPWANPPTSLEIDETFAVYDCLGSGTDRWDCSVADILPVGAKTTKGTSRFGPLDLAGSMREWVLDAYEEEPMGECMNCARLSVEPRPRVLRGGAWDLNDVALRNETRVQASPGFRYRDIGFRCAREY